MEVYPSDDSNAAHPPAAAIAAQTSVVGNPVQTATVASVFAAHTSSDVTPVHNAVLFEILTTAG